MVPCCLQHSLAGQRAYCCRVPYSCSRYLGRCVRRIPAAFVQPVPSGICRAGSIVHAQLQRCELTARLSANDFASEKVLYMPCTTDRYFVVEKAAQESVRIHKKS